MLTPDPAPGAVRGGWRRYADLVKLKLSLLVLFSGAVGFCLASHQGVNFPALALFAIGSFCVIAGANAVNEIIERREDALMNRTRTRPLPAGSMGVGEAWMIALGLSGAGLFLLWSRVNPLTAALALLAFLLYVFAYTPAKKKGPWCTFVGAFPGAIPAMMGPAAVFGGFTPLSWILFGIVFLWQFPHFWAIAWLAREDYAKAGFRVFPGPRNERFIAYQILICSCLLLAVSPLLGLLEKTGPSYVYSSLALSFLLLAYGLRFWFKLSRPVAGELMRAALAYLPLLYIMMLFSKVMKPW